jgi:hypothetical protein
MLRQKISLPKKKGAIMKLMLAIKIILISFIFGGCSVYMAAKQPDKKDTSLLKRGTPRKHVIAEFGKPVYTIEKDDGCKKDVFVFVQGYSDGEKAGRAFFHGAADFFTLGLWEVVGTPAETLADGTEVKVEVDYDANDRVDQIFVLKGDEQIKGVDSKAIPIERLEKDGDFTTINLLNHTYHMGDDNVSRFNNPKPQGTVFEGGFNIADTDLSIILITIWVSDMKPYNHTEFLRGNYKTKLVINDSKIAILNDYISGTKDKDIIEEITIGVDKKIVRKGYNEIKINAGLRLDKNNYDDFEIHRIIVRYKR